MTAKRSRAGGGDAGPVASGSAGPAATVTLRRGCGDDGERKCDAADENKFVRFHNESLPDYTPIADRSCNFQSAAEPAADGFSFSRNPSPPGYSLRALFSLRRSSSVALLIALILGAPAPFASAATPPSRSISSSRQFIVYGVDRQLRGAVCEAAERCKREALQLLEIRDDWRTPIVLHVQANLAGAPLALLHLSQTGAGLKFQLDLSFEKDVRIPEIERELLRAIFLEMMYRTEPTTPAGTVYVDPPEWLLEGTRALATEKNRTALARTLAISGQTLALEEFLPQTRALLDSPSRDLHSAYSAALVAQIVETPEGRARLTRFVADLPRASNNLMAEFQAHFPEFGKNPEEIAKTWRAGVLRFAAKERYRVLGCDETERQLRDLLQVEVKTTPPKVYALEEFSRFVREPAAVADLKRLGTQLLLLSGRASPIYRPIVGEYQEIVARLLRRRTYHVARRLTELNVLRESLRRQMSAIGDYLNWFEATQAQTESGVFREYLRAVESTSEPEPRRRDPISVYLDALETQF